jgi:fatty acid desaturase
MWNMPSHAEHYLYPSIAFHLLPALHREVRAALRHVAPGYVAANREIIQRL